jgi:hypothetical protein
LPIIPQLAALFTNASFIVYLNDTNSRIENTFKGNKIQFLKKEFGLFKNKYDLALALYTYASPIT